MARGRVFICYIDRITKYLQDEGCRYEVVGLNPNSKQQFWVFIRDEQLNKALDKWDLAKNC